MPSADCTRKPTVADAPPHVAWPQSPDDFEREESPRSTSAPPPIPPQRARSRARPRIGDWEIEFMLGSGSTGAVFAVSHREFRKRAALKISHQPIGRGQLAAKVFAREARVVQLVEHPSMPDIFATGTHAGRPYLVMERLKGETLDQLIARGALDRGQAIDHLRDVCDVLAVAHDALVVHRDLKLDNVFVIDAPSSHGPRIKLLDWGFARLLGEHDPLRGMAAGALNYLAPEQVRGEPITPATDIYSLGALSYRVLLGEAPFSGADAMEIVRRHIHQPPPDPALLWPEIPKQLAHVMVMMLAKEPARRPALDEVRAALDTARTARRRRISLTRASEVIGLPPSVRPSLKQRAIGVTVAIACIAAAAGAMLAV